MTRLYVLALLSVLGCVQAYNTSETWPNREHRGVWIATVDNIDWPLTPTSTVREQQNQLKYLIGQIHLARLNAVYFQVMGEGVEQPPKMMYKCCKSEISSVGCAADVMRYASVVQVEK